MLHYTACGLDYVYLRNGFTIHPLDDGEEGVSIKNAMELHEVIARRVIESHRRLVGQDVRFLRARLNRSQSTLARAIGFSRAAVARWEAAPQKPIPGPANRSLRYYYILTAMMKTESAARIQESLDVLDDQQDHEAAGHELRLKREGERWQGDPLAA